MPAPPRETALAAIDVPALLKATGISTRAVRHSVGARVFAQGAPANSVFYLQEGRVKLSVQPVRMATATAVAVTTALRIRKADMQRLLHEHREFSDRFISHMLVRNIRIEEDLVDQLFNSSEKRLARTLLLLAQYGGDRRPLELPRLSQETLAEMVGTTRSRVNFFMNKFRKLGFIEYNGGLKVNSALLSIVLHD